MADFDLTQTDAQVQSILNDGQNMQGAGAQTTLTTESVLLKDVNGNYHKILKSSFTEAIRDTLASLLVNNDKGTTINQIAAIANGDFGSITPANLASVLGVGGDNILRKTLDVNREWDTGLSVGSIRGATILALISYQWGNGDATASAIKGIRFGYTDSGYMQIEDVKVIGDNRGTRSETYSVSNNNTMVIKAGSGAALRILLLTNY